MPSFHIDPRNEAYAQLIDELIIHCHRFLLVDRYNGRNSSKQVSTILLELEPYLIDQFTYEDVIHGDRNIQSSAFYGDGTYYIYRCAEEAGEILKRYAKRLKDWNGPYQLEDLCFFDEAGKEVLTTVAHENIFGMSISDDEAEELMKRIHGLFFKLPKHQVLNALLDDAIKHKTDYLRITSTGISVLPAQIKELEELETLIIEEQDITNLPPELFELSKLRRLEIMVSDLAQLPPEINRLKSLKNLKIYNGTTFNPTPGWKLVPKEELRFKQLPAEIGELSELESLQIVYSGLTELPPELKNLKKLNNLIINYSLIEGIPSVVHEMPWLKYSNFSPSFGA